MNKAIINILQKLVLAVITAGGLAGAASAAPVIRTASGANAAAIQAVVDQFRTDLGTLNPNNGQSLQPAGLIYFDVKGMKSAYVVKSLREKNITASTAPYRESYVRLAPSLLNTEEEIETTLQQIRELV